jgi:hypothetical protein
VEALIPWAEEDLVVMVEDLVVAHVVLVVVVVAVLAGAEVADLVDLEVVVVDSVILDLAAQVVDLVTLDLVVQVVDLVTPDLVNPGLVGQVVEIQVQAALVTGALDLVTSFTQLGNKNLQMQQY